LILQAFIRVASRATYNEWNADRMIIISGEYDTPSIDVQNDDFDDDASFDDKYEGYDNDAFIIIILASSL